MFFFFCVSRIHFTLRGNIRKAYSRLPFLIYSTLFRIKYYVEKFVKNFQRERKIYIVRSKNESHIYLRKLILSLVKRARTRVRVVDSYTTSDIVHIAYGLGPYAQILRRDRVRMLRIGFVETIVRNQSVSRRNYNYTRVCGDKKSVVICAVVYAFQRARVQFFRSFASRLWAGFFRNFFPLFTAVVRLYTFCKIYTYTRLTNKCTSNTVNIHLYTYISPVHYNTLRPRAPVKSIHTHTRVRVYIYIYIAVLRTCRRFVILLFTTHVYALLERARAENTFRGRNNGGGLSESGTSSLTR